MKKIGKGQSMYEAMRDTMKFPAYWDVSNNSCTPHFHSSLELVYILEGEMNVLLDGVGHIIREGELLLVPSYTVHTFETPEHSREIVLLVPLAYIPSFQKICEKQRFQDVVVPKGALTDLICQYMKLLLEHGQSAALQSDSFTVRGLVYVILGALLENIPMEPIPKDSDHNQIKSVLHYLHQNYQHPISLSELADTFGYSRSRFSYIFNKNVGCAIPEYLNTLRVRKAARLLLEEKISITDAAMQAGFESTRTFYRTFGSFYGMSPTQYAKLAPKQPEEHGFMV